MAEESACINALLGPRNFAAFEQQTYDKHQQEADAEIVARIERVLQDPEVLQVLRHAAGRCALKFCGYRRIRIRLASGRRYQVESPVFLRAKPKDRRRRRYRKDVLRHFGLEYLGFHTLCSPGLGQRCVQMATLCPSFQIGAQVLTDLGTQMNHRLLRHIVYHLGTAGMNGRSANVVDDSYRQPGLRYLICIDGGRIRERRSRRGRKARGAKGRGYHTEWRGPYLITIVCVDKEGKMRKDLAPIYDGTVKKIDEAFALLNDYLGELNIEEAAMVTFCADGGEGIWPRIDALAASLSLPAERVHRVLDYTHAKQNLREIVELIHQGSGVWDYEYDDLLAQLKGLLWEGQIDQIEGIIKERLRRKRQRKKALRKLADYFGDVEKFQYAAFRAAGIPIGSGTVESAIRRVINLRIKGPGLFWYLQNAEKMIFLRSQVISGRWPSVLMNVLERRVNILGSSQLEREQAAA